MQIWDLDDLLQDSGSTLKRQTVVEDSNSDGMDLEINTPKSNGGILCSFRILK